MSAIASLLAQRAEIERQIAEATLPTLTSAKELLADERVSSLIADLQALIEDLADGDAKVQLTNIATVLIHVPVFIAAEHDRVTALLAPPAPDSQPAPTPTPEPQSE